MRGGLADNDRAFVHEGLDNIGVDVRNVIHVCQRAIAGLDAPGVDQVLDRHRQPFQLPGPARGVASVAFRRCLEGAVPVDHREGIEILLAGLGPGERQLRQCIGRRASFAKGHERIAQAGGMHAGTGWFAVLILHHRLSSKASSAASLLSPRSPTSLG
ncbi:hypothetical protein D3C72_1856940 [compost metagenome]